MIINNGDIFDIGQSVNGVSTFIYLKWTGISSTVNASANQVVSSVVFEYNKYCIEKDKY